MKKQKSYPGLSELIGLFYSSILNKTSPPLTPDSIINTVRICELIGGKLKDSEAETERQAEISFREAESKILPAEADSGTILVTGGTGFLGRFITAELRNNGWPVRVITRRMPFFAVRVPGVEYVVADLGENVPADLLDGVDVIVHCAAETYGGKEEHERNSLGATRIIMDAAIKSGVKKFIHISSIAVMKSGSEIARPLDENTPVDLDNLGRGPYVWGKAESEKIALDLSRESGIEVRIIRLGPLVDYDAFETPGRLGRELGPVFLAMGNRLSKLPVCRVQTASQVIRSYVSDFNEAPQILNLIEPDSTTRADLTTKLLKNRPDLKIIWMPFFMLKIISPCLKLLQLILRPGKNPIDIQAAFASEDYNIKLSDQIIQKACNK
ncbi:MAG: NAD(P)-dependent oxidoreductase [Candidatus Mariimomonas ferrooxydans]